MRKPKMLLHNAVYCYHDWKKTTDCKSAIEVTSIFSSLLTTQKMRKVAVTLGWLVYRTRSGDQRAYCPMHRKQHEDEPALELTRPNLPRGSKPRAR